MIIPIRCFTCGKPIGQFWEEWQQKLAKEEQPKKILDGFGLDRYCCRAVFLGHVDLVDITGEYSKT